MKTEVKNKISSLQIEKFGGVIMWNENISVKLGGISQKTYNKILKNLAQPELKELCAWANWLDVPIEHLFDYGQKSLSINKKLFKPS